MSWQKTWKKHLYQNFAQKKKTMLQTKTLGDTQTKTLGNTIYVKTIWCKHLLTSPASINADKWNLMS